MSQVVNTCHIFLGHTNLSQGNGYPECDFLTVSLSPSRPNWNQAITGSIQIHSNSITYLPVNITVSAKDVINKT